MKDITNQLESILFLKGEPVSANWLARTIGKTENEIKSALDELAEQLNERGIRLIKNGNEVVLAAAPENAEILKEIVKLEFDSELSKSAVETLSIIIYKTAASRAEIDYVRGVNSSFILRNLLVRGLIEKEVKRGKDSAYVYKPSFKLLEYLGVSSLEQLPDYGLVSEKLKEFFNSEKQEKKGVVKQTYSL